MQIEENDLFMVTRGFRMGDIDLSFGMSAPKPPQYDRSHEGRVYRAISVCGPVIAAQCVADCVWRKAENIGKVFHINTGEVEIWPVTEQHLAALGNDINA